MKRLINLSLAILLCIGYCYGARRYMTLVVPTITTQTDLKCAENLLRNKEGILDYDFDTEKGFIIVTYETESISYNQVIEFVNKHIGEVTRPKPVDETQTIEKTKKKLSEIDETDPLIIYF